MFFPSSFLLPLFALLLLAATTLAAESQPAGYPIRPIRIVVPQSPGGTQLGALLFGSMAGISLVHVPYKGGGPAMTALLGGEVQLYFAPMPSALPLVKAGRLKALAVTSRKRSPVAPELPSMAEAGLQDYDESTWNGVFAPARTPASIIGKLNGELEAILKTPTMRERLAAEGAEPAWTRPEEFAGMVRREVAKWARVISRAGIQPE